MPASLTTVHLNRALADLSIFLENSDTDYMLPKLCARRPVSSLSNNFFRYGREAAKKSVAGSNARMLSSVTEAGAPAPEVQYTVSNGSYQCRRYSLRELVTDKEVQQADSPLQPVQDAGRILRRRIMNDAEYVLSRIAADYSLYPAGNRTQLTTGANGTSWNKASAAGTGSEPITDLRTGRIALEKIIQRKANVLAMSSEVLYHLGDHNDLTTILQYTDPNYLQDNDGVPPMLRGLRVVQGQAVADTAADGAAFSGDYLFSDHADSDYDCAIIAYVPPEKTVGERAFSSFIWFDAADETTRQRGVSLRSYRDDARRGWWVEAAMTFDVQAGIVDSNSKVTGAYMISRAIIP